MCLLILSFIHSFIHAFIHSFMHSCIHSFIHSCIHSFIHSCIHAFIHSFMHSFNTLFKTGCKDFYLCKVALVLLCILHPSFRTESIRSELLGLASLRSPIWISTTRDRALSHLTETVYTALPLTSLSAKVSSVCVSHQLLIVTNFPLTTSPTLHCAIYFVREVKFRTTGSSR